MEILSARVLLRPRDPEATLAFYRDTLGLAIARTYPGGVVFFAGSTLIEVASHMTSDSDESTTALWLQVRDIETTQRVLESAGVSIAREARTEPWGLREMHVPDPDGRQLIFVEIPADHPLRADQRAVKTEFVSRT
ncbi:glyoxalase [Williamsia sp. Leaf354]|jgi:lactoylglutathione lyase|uniref:VOC family protein n=1 Tax=Williamsia sp. Leaf354 TaxID=1736349 RepID=UPI000700B207|nr:VOC family protein [Williamsia sp. Leaf354]KQR96252.1 glyoxalase [Williamsia sp. Leaf354]